MVVLTDRYNTFGKDSFLPRRKDANLGNLCFAPARRRLDITGIERYNFVRGVLPSLGHPEPTLRARQRPHGAPSLRFKFGKNLVTFAALAAAKVTRFFPDFKPRDRAPRGRSRARRVLSGCPRDGRTPPTKLWRSIPVISSLLLAGAKQRFRRFAGFLLGKKLSFPKVLYRSVRSTRTQESLLLDLISSLLQWFTVLGRL